MQSQIEQLKARALQELESIDNAKDFDAWRVRYLGKKSELTGVLRGLAALSLDERKTVGALANQGWRPGPGAGDPLGERSPLHSDTGEIRVDPDRRIFALATLRSACGSAPAGTAFEAGALRVQVLHSDATVAAISN